MDRYGRRIFLKEVLAGAGAVTFGGTLVSFTSQVRFPAGSSGSKRLFATTDFYDNILINQRGSRYGEPLARDAEYYANHRCFMNAGQIDGLHDFLAGAGVTRHQWMFDTIWTLYEDYPHGFDLLRQVTESAHRKGIELFAVIKPFEGGGFGYSLPLTMPCPVDAPVFRDFRGIFPLARRFPAEHPEMNLKRRPGTYVITGPVAAIRLVKGDDRPTRIRAEHLTLFTSDTNNQFTPYKGPLTFRETIETRYRFPYRRQSRILHLENLKIPPGHRYLLIRCSLADDPADFSNEKGSILELAGPGGNVIPHILSTGQVHWEDHAGSFYRSPVMQRLVRYIQLPEVQAEIRDVDRMKEHYRDFYGFGEYSHSEILTFDKQGYLAAACGKPEYLTGNLHPVYPEVREHWLGMIRYCLDRGVDGINLRIGNHSRVPDYWEYGFNDPVMEALKGKADYFSAGRINGEAYTRFLREARALVKSYGKKLVHHLETDILMPDDRPAKLNSLPPNFTWEWEKWVSDLADEFEIRGIYQLRPWNFMNVVDTYSSAVRAAGKLLYLQGDFHGMDYDGPFGSTEAEVELVRQHDGLDGYVFYETANITRVNEAGEVEGNPDVVSIISRLK